jgi:hypothetical protein
MKHVRYMYYADDVRAIVAYCDGHEPIFIVIDDGGGRYTQLFERLASCIVGLSKTVGTGKAIYRCVKLWKTIYELRPELWYRIVPPLSLAMPSSRPSEGSSSCPSCRVNVQETRKLVRIKL